MPGSVLQEGEFHLHSLSSHMLRVLLNLQNSTDNDFHQNSLLELSFPDQVELRYGPHRLLHRVLQRSIALHADNDRDRETPDSGPAEGSEKSDALGSW